MQVNALDHVNIVTLDLEGTIAFYERLQAMGATYRTSGITGTGLRQIFVGDPNNVNLELNFPGD